jgi:hypothetical protein
VSDSYVKTNDLFELMWRQLGGDKAVVDSVSVCGGGAVASAFALTDFVSASLAAVGAAIAELLALDGGAVPSVWVDRVLSSACLVGAVSRHLVSVPRGGFDRLSDFFPTADGRWLRTHTNYPHHRDRTIEALDIAPTKEALAAAIAGEPADVIEARICEHGGVAAASRSLVEWAAHPQGAAVAAEPMVEVTGGSTSEANGWAPLPERPLVGIRVLDLTRVIAGPTATRTLAGYGAEVLRIDPPGFEEAGGPQAAGESTLGKRCTRLDLHSAEGHRRFLELLSEADVFVHGLRPEALDRLGLGAEVRDQTRPGLVEVTLNAYGWTGPWAARRGFDSVVQTASGMVLETARWGGSEVPRLAPPILDYGTGYLMAAAAIQGLTERLRTGRGSASRLALARTAAGLIAMGTPDAQEPIPEPYPGPYDPAILATPAGAVQLIAPPVIVGSAQLRWDRTGERLGSSAPTWAGFARSPTRK